MPQELADRRARKKARTRVEVRRAAQRLFADRGFDAVTVADVAEAADVAVQTVFNHFATKEELFFSGRDWWAHGAAAAVRSRRPGTGAVATAHAWLESHVLVVPRLLRRPAIACYLETIMASQTLQLQQRELMRRAEFELSDALHATWVEQLGDLPGLRVPADLLSGVLVTSARVVLTEQWRRGWGSASVEVAEQGVETERAEMRELSQLTFSGVIAGLGAVADHPADSSVLARVAQLEKHLPPDLVVARRARPGGQRPEAPTTGSSAPSTSAASSSAGSGSANAV
ncbi:transcriptional regulator, TetR family [Klenkia marina]|uniref:Transcriptional regulator, TetR family n=1 Tax=Klenkia marina TaxID=1960309 RepID=A0A1G4XGU5_9ACTN|nr:TetR family transcriptional regulator [Klenkia marina]SCX40254.1 transcriptional regulator, TetR family [Klenkia marina]